MEAKRDTWPWEARACEGLHLLGLKLREHQSLDSYYDLEQPESHDGFVYQSKCLIIEQNLLKSEDIMKCVSNLNNICLNCEYKYNPDLRIWDKFKLLSVLGHIGTELANSEWWNKYEKIAGMMGTDCPLSIKTATAMFEKDKRANEIKTLLGYLVNIMEDYNVTTR